MRLTRRLVINLIFVLLLGIVMVGWVLLSLVGGGAFTEPLRVTADFASSGGVFTNQEVTYRGVLVGKVGDLELNADGVNIELLIDPEWEGTIPSDLLATVQSKSAVGEQFVNLSPRSGGGEMLESGDVIAREDTKLPVDFQALLRSLDRVLGDIPPERASRLISNLAEGLGGRDREIATILESLGTLSDSFASVAPEQERLLQNATRAGSAFLATKDEFSRAIRAADRVFAGLGDEPEEIERLLTTNDRLAREGIALLARRGDELHAGIASLADFVNYQLREKDELIKSLEYTPAFLHAIEDASVPWRSPDGRFFYRIRAGLVMDNVESTWPCKYELPFEYERHYFEREKRDPVTDMECVPEADATVAELAATSDLVTTMQEYAAEEEAIETISLVDVEVPVMAPGEGFVWPLQGVVTSPYGPRNGRLHAGIDIDGVTGDPVVAAQGGRVVLAGEMSGYGTTVVLEHPDGLQTLYAHLSAAAVEAGDEVPRGGLVGLVGCTGYCFGDHLHFEIHVDGIPVDPLPLLPGGPLFLTGVDLTAAPEEL